MVRGEHPRTRHDQTPWTVGDGTRFGDAGRPLGWRAVVIFVKGDWSEYAHTLGLPTWSDQISPCPICFASPDELHTTMHLSVHGTSRAKKTLATYSAVAMACEVEVTVTRAKQV